MAQKTFYYIFAFPILPDNLSSRKNDSKEENQGQYGKTNLFNHNLFAFSFICLAEGLL